MNDTQSALERAIEKLGAVEVAPGKIAELIEGAGNHKPAVGAKGSQA